jgi:uncharacterized protein (DUF983 family)
MKLNKKHACGMSLMPQDSVSLKLWLEVLVWGPPAILASK